MIKYFWILVFVFVSFYLYSQPTVFSNKIITSDRQNTAFSIIETDSNFILLGIGYKSLNHYSHIFFIKTDFHGDTLYYKKIRCDSFDLFPGVSGSLYKINNGYILGGTNALNQNRLLLFKYNNEGDTVWTKTFPDDSIHYPFITGIQAKEAHDGGFVLIGQVQIGSHYNIDRFILLKTDSLGNEQWLKDYGLPNTVNRGENIILTPDGGYLLGGSTFYNKYDGLIIKIDSAGNQQWQKVIGGPNNDGPARIALAKDSNYVVATTYSVYDDMGSPDSKIRIQKFDTAGNIIWDKQYCKPQAERKLNSIKTLSDGGFIVCGDAFSDTVISYHRGYLMRFDENGDSLWYRQYKNYSEPIMLHELFDVIQTSDGGFAACGDINDDYYNVFYDIWLLKTDSLGNAPGCEYVGMENLSANSGLSSVLKAYPNPANDFVTIEFEINEELKSAELVILDQQGKKIKSFILHKNQSYLNINTSDLSNGLFYLILKNNGTVIKTTTISIINK
jgi:hypothetical protein